MASAALSSALLEYGSRLSISSGSKVLADVTGVEVLMEYLHAAGQNWPHMPAVTVIGVNDTTMSPIRPKIADKPDWQAVICDQFDGKTLAKTKFDNDIFTNVIFDFTSGSNTDLTDSERLELLKHVQYILQPKGIALLAFAQSDFKDDDELKALLEDAVFERGRIRIVYRESHWIALVMKWDLLYA